MKTSQPFMALLSVTVVMGSLLSGTGAAQEYPYPQYEYGVPGFSEPLSSPDSLTQTSFLESREMTMACAAVIAGLFGLNLLFRQFKEKHQPAEEQLPEASTDQPEEQPSEASTDQPAEGQENQETVETVAEQEEPSAPATEEEQNKEEEVVAAQ